MLEIIIIWRLTKYIGTLATQKGLKKLGYQIMAVILWISGEIVGGFLGGIVFKSIDSFWLNYATALVGAILGSSIAFLIMKILPNQELPDQNVIATSQEKSSGTRKFARSAWIPAFVILCSTSFCLCAGAIDAIKISDKARVQQYVGKPTPIPDKMYVELRTAALHRTASELKLNVDPNSNQPYGVIMDWNVGQATSTIVSFATGDASMYYSTGGGWLNGYAFDKVNSASKQFVTVAGDYVEKLNKVTTFPLPPVGYMRFYIITPQGVYGSGDIDSDTLAKDNINFSSLNDAAQYLIHEISLVPQK